MTKASWKHVTKWDTRCHVTSRDFSVSYQKETFYNISEQQTNPNKQKQKKVL